MTEGQQAMEEETEENRQYQRDVVKVELLHAVDGLRAMDVRVSHAGEGIVCVVVVAKVAVVHQGLGCQEVVGEGKGTHAHIQLLAQHGSTSYALTQRVVKLEPNPIRVHRKRVS
jgi:hypothetical protein